VAGLVHERGRETRRLLAHGSISILGDIRSSGVNMTCDDRLGERTRGRTLR